MLRQPINTRWTVLLGVLSVLILLAAYTVISLRQHQKNPDDTTIPTWKQLQAGVKKVIEVNPRSGERWLMVDAEATASRLFLGLLFGVLGAILLGVLMGCFPVIEALLAPPLSLLAKVPPTAALAVFFVLVGTDTEMYVTMIAFGILPVLAQSIYLAVRDVPAEFLYKSYTIGASNAEVIWNIIVRAIFPKLIDTVRLQIGPAMVYLIAAEMVCGDVGFGYRIRLQSRLLNMNVVYPYLAILAAFGFAMDFGLRFAQKICCPWYAHEKG
ncbi:MAG: ABC transporter permease subunit [PVC group bacterium]